MALKADEEYYIPKFEFDGKQPPEKLKAQIGKALIMAHNEYGKFIRPYFPGWNAAYDGPKDHLDENGYMLDSSESQYIRYLQDCASKLMPLFNRKVVSKNKYFKKYICGDELELIGIMKNGCKVSFCMKKASSENLLAQHKGS